MKVRPTSGAAESRCVCCGKMVVPVLEDYGFAHAHGAEVCWEWECPRCGEIFQEGDVALEPLDPRRGHDVEEEQ